MAEIDDKLISALLASTEPSESNRILTALDVLNKLVRWEDLGGGRESLNTQTDLPVIVDLVDDTVTFKGDVKAFGEFLAQGSSIQFDTTMIIGSSWTQLFYQNLQTGIQSYPIINKIIDDISEGPSYSDRYLEFVKDDGIGPEQPFDSETFGSILFTENLSGENKYYFILTAPLFSDVVTKTWYLRSPSGLVNAYLKIYSGVVTDPNDPDYIWQNHTDKDIRNKTGLLTDLGGVGIDITFPLGKEFFQNNGELITYVFTADNDFTLQGATLPLPGPTEFPYVKGDGSFWRKRKIFEPTRFLTEDFAAQEFIDYKIDMNGAVANLNVTIEPQTTQFSIGDYDDTFNNTNKVNVIIGVDTIELGALQKRNKYQFVKDGNTFRVYENGNRFLAVGNIT